jgi:hypothetical protein
MKKTIFFIFGWLVVTGVVSFAQTADIDLGRVFFPKDFVHSAKDYGKGIYRVMLTQKDNVPFFSVYSPKKELLFDEMAVLKPFETKTGRKGWRVRKELLKGDEYFRLRVLKPGQLVMAYFLLKAEKTQGPAQ